MQPRIARARQFSIMSSQGGDENAQREPRGSYRVTWMGVCDIEVIVVAVELREKTW